MATIEDISELQRAVLLLGQKVGVLEESVAGMSDLEENVNGMLDKTGKAIADLRARMFTVEQAIAALEKPAMPAPMPDPMPAPVPAPPKGG